MGTGMEKDLPRAAEFFRAAASQGQAAAQCNLGAMCAQGLGMPLDTAAARAWYEKSAAQGNRDAQFNLALLLASGPAADTESARHWAAEAAAAGHAQAQALLGKLAEDEGSAALGSRFTHALGEALTLLQDLSSNAGSAVMPELLRELQELQMDWAKCKRGIVGESCNKPQEKEGYPSRSCFENAEIVD
mmetsp:Transcript_50164/g.112808  ORF Transcript_50164/g.112808 Transcript_50164/m.112808 type:complete len:189 (+) Transcript_50164:1-567(+)